MKLKFSDLAKVLLPPFLVYMANEVFQGFWPELYRAKSIDTYFHFLGGMTIAFSVMVALPVAERFKWIKVKNAGLAFCIVVAFVMAAAVFWEFYEFLHDLIYDTHFQPSLRDTMKDLLMGTMGGSLWYLGHFLQRRRVW